MHVSRPLRIARFLFPIVFIALVATAYFVQKNPAARPDAEVSVRALYEECVNSVAVSEYSLFQIRRAHQYYCLGLQKLLSPSPQLYFLVFFLGIALILAFFNYGKTSIKISALHIVATVIALILIVASCYLLYLRPGIFNGELTFFNYPSAPPEEALLYPLWKAIAGLALNIAIALLWMALVTSSVIGFGRTLLRRITSENNILIRERVVLSFALGTMAIVAMLFLMALTHLLHRFTAAALFGSGCLLALRNMRTYISWLKEKFEVPIKHCIPGLLLLTFIAINFLEILRPIPIAWDDLNHYQNTARIVGETGLLDARMPYPWELFMSMGYSVTSSATAAFLIAFLGSSIALLAFYSILKRLFTGARSLPLLLSTLFYTMPAVFFQAAQDLKVDLGLMAIVSAAFLAIVIAMRHQDEPDTYNPKLLFLASMLLGFSLSIKYTAFFALLPCVLIAAYYTLKHTLKARHFLVCIILMALPVLPWWGFNAAVLKTWNPRTIAFPPEAMLSYPDLIQRLDTNYNNLRSQHPEWPENIVPTSHPPVISAQHVEVERYIGYGDSIKKYLLLPLTATLNTNVPGYHVDIGFLWLALIAGLVLFLPIKLSTTAERIVYFATCVYWLLWIIFSRGIIWYGLPGFIGLAAIIGWQLTSVTHAKTPIKSLLRNVIVLWLIAVSLMRFDAFSNPDILFYATRIVNATQAYERLLPAYTQIIPLMNAPPRADGTSNVIYRVGTSLKYFIKDYASRTIEDPFLENFTNVFAERDRELTVLRLKLMGVRFIVVDLNVATIDQTPNQILMQKFAHMREFLGLDEKLKAVDPNASFIYHVVSPEEGILFAELPPLD